MRVLAAAIVLPSLLSSLLLAGCSDDAPSDAPGAAPGPSVGTGGAERPLLPPAWRVGDWWNFTSDFRPEGYTLVVGADGGNDWLVSTDNPQVGFFDAAFDISYMGPQRKIDLMGSQGDDRIEFFRWPLTAGAKWTTTWDGAPVSIEASKESATRFTFRAARDDGSLYATYDYDAEVRWFRQFNFYGPDSQLQFASALQRSGSNFTGDLVQWDLNTVFEARGAPEPFDGTLFDLPPTATDVYLSYSAQCAIGLLQLSTGPFTARTVDAGYVDQTPCPKDITVNEVVGTAVAATESWGAGLFASGDVDAEANVDATVWVRTLTTFKAGQAPA